MGKSEGNALPMMETASERWVRLAPAVTDPARRTRHDPGTPERCGIYALHELASAPARVAEVAEGCRTAGIGCVDCKRALNESLEGVLAPIQLRRRELAAQAGLVAEVLHEGAARARVIVSETREVVQDKVGIVRY
jgi:tryptophanyl-tRNA synthetase